MKVRAIKLPSANPLRWVNMRSRELNMRVLSRATGYDTGNGCLLFQDQDFKLDDSKNWQDPGFEQTNGDPVVCVDWGDAKAYVAWLSDITGEGYRLMSETEWEYVARGDTDSTYYWPAEAEGCDYNNWADQSILGRTSRFR